MPKQCPAGYAMPTQNFATLLRSLAVRNVAFPKRFNAVWAIPKLRQAKQVWLCNAVSLLSLRFRGLSPLFKSFAAYAIPMRRMSGLCNSHALLVVSMLCLRCPVLCQCEAARISSVPCPCGTMFIRSMLFPFASRVCHEMQRHCYAGLGIAPAHLISAVPLLLNSTLFPRGAWPIDTSPSQLGTFWDRKRGSLQEVDGFLVLGHVRRPAHLLEPSAVLLMPA